MLRNLSLKKKILIMLTAALLFIAVPLTIIQSLKQQTMKQRASNDFQGMSILLAPASLTKNIGESMEVEIHLLNSEQREVSAVDVSYGDYNPSMFESVSFQPSIEFNMIINDPGHYAGIAFPESHKKAVDINLGTVKFEKSKEAGVFALNIKSMRINIAGKHGAVIPETIGGSYRIENLKLSPVSSGAGGVFPTPTPTEALTLTPTPMLSATPALIPTSTLTSSPTPAPDKAGYNACLVPCNDLEDTTDALVCIQVCKTQYGR